MKVNKILELLHKGHEINNMMQVTGEEGITIEDYILYHKSLMFDMAYLQQDAYDPVDVSVPLERQKTLFNFLYDIIAKDFKFTDKMEARNYFVKLTGLIKNLNYAQMKSSEYNKYHDQITEMTGVGEYYNKSG
jgi:V/A-type H+/Na+-transporting ATPase subunit A